MERGIVLALGLSFVVYAWHAVQVALGTLLLLPAMFPGAPVDPLAWRAAPTHETLTLSYVGGSIDTDLFRPASGGRHGAIVLLLGAGDLPRIDVAFHFADELARSGVVVMIPRSQGLLEERLTYAEVDAIRSELKLLDDRSDVDRRRVGLIGLSAAGGLCIVAAAESDLRDRIAFVNTLGTYDDARSLIVDVASRSIDVDGELHEWVPDDRTEEVVTISLISTVAEATDRALLQQAFVAHEAVDWSALSAAAQPVKNLLEELQAGTTRPQAEMDVAALPADTLRKLEQISPSTRLQDVKARLYVMHDVDDAFIPFTQSRALVRQAPPGLVERYTEFSIFAHVIPERPVPWQTFLPDVWRLFWHADALLLEVD